MGTKKLVVVIILMLLLDGLIGCGSKNPVTGPGAGPTPTPAPYYVPVTITVNAPNSGTLEIMEYPADGSAAVSIVVPNIGTSPSSMVTVFSFLSTTNVEILAWQNTLPCNASSPDPIVGSQQPLLGIYLNVSSPVTSLTDTGTEEWFCTTDGTVYMTTNVTDKAGVFTKNL